MLATKTYEVRKRDIVNSGFDHMVKPDLFRAMMQAHSHVYGADLQVFHKVATNFIDCMEQV